jgi:hypothetical protein
MTTGVFILLALFIISNGVWFNACLNIERRHQDSLRSLRNQPVIKDIRTLKPVPKRDKVNGLINKHE